MSEQPRGTPVFRPQDEPTFSCATCRDEPSGHVVFWCEGFGEYRVLGPSRRGSDLVVKFCRRTKLHPPHTFTDRCHCYGHNATVERRKQREREQRQK